MKPASCCATGAFCSPVTIPHSQRDPSQAKTLATFRSLGPADQSPWQLTGDDGVDLVALGSVALEGLVKSCTIRGVLGSELADMPDQRSWRFDRDADYGPFERCCSRPDRP